MISNINGKAEAEDIEIDLKDQKASTQTMHQPAPKVLLGFDPNNKPFMPVFISIRAWASLWQHAFINSDREVGGLLVGDVCAEDANFSNYLLVCASLRASHAVEDKSSVTFTHNTWNKLCDQVESKFPEKRILGWYHTHPGYDVFLSSHDQFIHNNFFNLPYQFALVLDPVKKKHKLFNLDHGSFMGTNLVYVYINNTMDEVEILGKLLYPNESIEKTKRLLSKLSSIKVNNKQKDKFAVAFDDKRAAVLSKELFI